MVAQHSGRVTACYCTVTGPLREGEGDSDGMRGGQVARDGTTWEHSGEGGGGGISRSSSGLSASSDSLTDVRMRHYACASCSMHLLSMFSE